MGSTPGTVMGVEGQEASHTRPTSGSPCTQVTPYIESDALLIDPVAGSHPRRRPQRRGSAVFPPLSPVRAVPAAGRLAGPHRPAHHRTGGSGARGGHGGRVPL